jgi:hypothetical protein
LEIFQRLLKLFERLSTASKQIDTFLMYQTVPPLARLVSNHSKTGVRR